MPFRSKALGALQRVALRGLGLGIYRVRGESMRPGFADGDLVLVRSRWRRPPEPGDVVVAREPGNGRILVKRVLSRGPATVYLGSDDPEAGRDSRHFGSVPIENLVGRVIRHLPLHG